MGKEVSAFVELAEAHLIDPTPLTIPTAEDDKAPVDWVEKLSPILSDLPLDRRMDLCKQHQVNDRTIRRWAALSLNPGDRRRSSLELFCVRFAREVLGRAGVPVPDHPANVFAAYASIAPGLRADAKDRLETFTDDFGPVAASREFKINRRTVRSWIDHPERIPIDKAVHISNRTPSCS